MPIVVLVLATSIAAIATTSFDGSGNPPATPGRTLKITGHIKGMYPGREAILKLHIRNPFPLRVTVTRVRVTVTRGEGALTTCPAKMLRVRSWRGSRWIPPHKFRIVRMPIRMRATAPDVCQGTRWQLYYSATSTRR